MQTGCHKPLHIEVDSDYVGSKVFGIYRAFWKLDPSPSYVSCCNGKRVLLSWAQETSSVTGLWMMERDSIHLQNVMCVSDMPQTVIRAQHDYSCNFCRCPDFNSRPWWIFPIRNTYQEEQQGQRLNVRKHERLNFYLQCYYIVKSQAFYRSKTVI